MGNFESISLNSIADNDSKAVDAVFEKMSRGGFRLLASGDDALGAGLESLAGSGGARRRTETLAGRRTQPQDEGYPRAVMEAIVLSVVRPPLLVRDGTFVPPDPAESVDEVIQTVNAIDRAKVDPAIAITGRVEFANVPGVPFVGTGWVIDKPESDKAIVVTNRHVAAEFATSDGRGGYLMRTLPNSAEYIVNLDFIEEHGTIGEAVAPVVRVRFIAGPRSADIALLEIQGEVVRDVDPIQFSSQSVDVGAPVGVIGYPAYDSRNDPDDMRRYFGNIYNVKRFAFGNVTGVDNQRSELIHDATTLGGNSGSVVFDRGTGDAIGLHFAGEYKRGNYAVNIEEVKAALRGLSSTSVVPSSMPTEAAGDRRSRVADLKDRGGYNSRFLGRGKTIRPPQPGPTWKDDLADVIDADSGGKTKELNYQHFSVWMCESRKLPLVTAVNIDGAKAKRLGREDKWYIDGRLGDEFQTDNAAYSHNPLDRGHMVRREDPVWGSLETASQANIDTFHYTNAAPQHKDLNQRDWVNLENYVLGNARTRKLKVSVFTGPVFADDDPKYRNLVRLPQSFWKIAAIVNDDTGKLSVTGYLLSQGDLIKGLTGEFVYGAFRTYQVEVAEIGRLARLDVDHLVMHDAFARRRHSEGLAESVGRFQVVNGAGDLVL